MQTLKIDLENCFGIKRLKHEFDFSNDNVIAIYARNGLMKTSFSNTFNKIEEDKMEEIKDKIFNVDGVVNVKWDERDIQPNDVFVIKSLEPSYASDSVSALLLNDNMKSKIKVMLTLKDRFLKILSQHSGLKVSKAGKKIYEVETQLVEDFGFKEDSFLFNLKFLAKQELIYDCSNIRYSSIFDSTVLKKIKSDEFQEKIKDFLSKSDEIYAGYDFLAKGKLTLPKLKDIEKNLKNNEFFIKQNYIGLSGGIKINDIQELNEKIIEIEEILKAVPTFKDIEKMLSDAKGMVLRDIIESNPSIVSYLAENKLDELKKNIWISYIHLEGEKFEELLHEYEKLEKELKEINIDDTPWKKALSIFEERFIVPYKMEISNLKGAIIGESIPRVEFSFKDEKSHIHMNRSELENLNVLSQGEKRALYLLNIIFDIEKMKNKGEEKLIIIDDIADSFDYRNKYAIVEYLCDMAQNNGFYLIILTHNFDFYRTVCSRLGVSKKENRLSAELKENKLVLKEESYNGQPFNSWKNKMNSKNVLALIPFVRNIIEFGVDKRICTVKGITKDAKLFNYLLHEKDKTDIITFQDLKVIYKEYIGKDEFLGDIDLDESVIHKLYDIADCIGPENVALEDKIILAIAIRHKAEKVMIECIRKYNDTLFWKWNGKLKSGSATECMNHINKSANQTRELFSAYKQFSELEELKIMGEVNIMTPENIHLNSFMYEPILDMDIRELMKLYSDVNKISKEI